MPMCLRGMSDDTLLIDNANTFELSHLLKGCDPCTREWCLQDRHLLSEEVPGAFNVHVRSTSDIYWYVAQATLLGMYIIPR